MPCSCGRCLIPDSDSLVLLREKMPIFDSGSVTYPNYLDWRAMQRSFTDLALFRPDSMNFRAAAKRRRQNESDGGVMTWNMMSDRRVKPLLGRDFAEGKTCRAGRRLR